MDSNRIRKFLEELNQEETLDLSAYELDDDQDAEELDELIAGLSMTELLRYVLVGMYYHNGRELERYGKELKDSEFRVDLMLKKRDYARLHSAAAYLESVNRVIGDYQKLQDELRYRLSSKGWL